MAEKTRGRIVKDEEIMLLAKVMEWFGPLEPAVRRRVVWYIRERFPEAFIETPRTEA